MKIVKTVVMGVGSRVRELVNEGKSNNEILEIVRKENPLRKTTYSCIAWYKNDIKKKAKLVDDSVGDDSVGDEWEKSEIECMLENGVGGESIE